MPGIRSRVTQSDGSSPGLKLRVSASGEGQNIDTSTLGDGGFFSSRTDGGIHLSRVRLSLKHSHQARPQDPSDHLFTHTGIRSREQRMQSFSKYFGIPPY